jgi:hypothetical protein
MDSRALSSMSDLELEFRIAELLRSRKEESWDRKKFESYRRPKVVEIAKATHG